MNDFTLEELFGEQGEGAECHECGAHVINLPKHVQWHNKLLP